MSGETGSVSNLVDPQSKKKLRHSPGAVRHVEKRRTGTCQFADRVARISLDTYRTCVPTSFREKQPQTVVAAIVAHFEDTGELQVLSLGVGTKFLTEEKLREEEGRVHVSEQTNDDADLNGYGWRVRDCHAEVLARRGLRRQMGLELLRMRTHRGSDHGKNQLQDMAESRPILQPTEEENALFELRPGVTLHLYSSSAPCGNATLKKFTKMQRETFDNSLGSDEWPHSNHELIPTHSIKLGGFALLVKRDVFAPHEGLDSREFHVPKGKLWPSQANDDWCPPGTSIPSFHKGSLHTCSDKICRWNCLGVQGSLLSSVFAAPLYLTSVTVGRKLTPIVCRRALCCRAHGFPEMCIPKNEGVSTDANKPYSLQHPAIMGTTVYMDDGGVLDMAAAELKGKDVTFDSTLSWVWWVSIAEERRDRSRMAECIDGTTGLASDSSSSSHDPGCGGERIECPSLVCTAELTRQYFHYGTAPSSGQSRSWTKQGSKQVSPSLSDLRKLKRSVSSDYERAKDSLLQRHRVFRQWKRREYKNAKGNT